MTGRTANSPGCGDPQLHPVRAAEAVRAGLCEAAPAVRRFLFGMCGDWHEAEDMTQQALLKAWQNRSRFDGRAEVRTWLFAIARNHWRDRLRRARGRPPASAGPPVEDRALAANAPSPQAAAARAELAAAVQAAVQRLPAEQREALALRESRGLTFRQIGELLGVSAPTVKSRVRYALMKLARELKAFAPELEP